MVRRSTPPTPVRRQGHALMKASRKVKGEPGDDEDDPDAVLRDRPARGIRPRQVGGSPDGPSHRASEPGSRRARSPRAPMSSGAGPAPPSRGLDAPSANGFDA